MKKAIILLSAVAACAAAGVQATEAEAQPPVAPAWLRITRVTANGSGCPMGTVVADISPDNRAVTLIYSDFDASVGPNEPLSESNKSCSILIGLNYPAGYSFSIVTADWFGFANLANRVVGRQQSTYWFQGQFSRRATFDTTLVGPYFGEYTRRDTLGTAAYVWSPCGGNGTLSINSNVAVSNNFNPGATGYMNVIITEVAVRVTYGLTWRLC